MNHNISRLFFYLDILPLDVDFRYFLKMEVRSRSYHYIPKTIEDTRIHYRRFVNALRVGITNVYYRGNKDQNEIVRIFDGHIFMYVHSIHFFLIHELEHFVSSTGQDIMYQNHLALIILFFIVDFQKTMKSKIEYPNQVVSNFVHQLFIQGFRDDLHGISPFQCNLMEIVEKMDLSCSFISLRLLHNPRISILYQKFPVAVPSIPESPKKPTIIVPSTLEDFRMENAELKSVVKVALQEIQRLQTDQATISRDRDIFRVSFMQIFEENAKLKKKISEMENQQIAQTISSPQSSPSLLEGWDINILGLTILS